MENVTYIDTCDQKVTIGGKERTPYMLKFLHF